MGDQALISDTVSFWDIAMAPASMPSCGCWGKRAAECARKWATPLWTSVKAGSGLTVNCMCRMGRSRRHNYTNPLLISGSVGKLTRNDARDVASPGIPNKKTLERARLPQRDERNRWRAGDSHGSPLSCPRVALAERLALWTVAGAAGPWLVPASVIKFSLLTPPGNVKWHLTRRVMNCARQEAGGMTAKEASLAAANLGIHQFIIPPRTNPPTPRCHLSLIMLIRTPLLSWRNGRLILTRWSQCFAHMRLLTGFNCSRIFFFFFFQKEDLSKLKLFLKKKKKRSLGLFQTR